MDRPHPPGQTMAATDSREPAMSLDRQPAQTGYSPGRPPGRGRGERLVIIAGVLAAVLSVVGIVAILTGKDEKPEVVPTALPSAAAPSTTPSTVPVLRTPEDLAAAEAEARYREFLRVDDEVGQGGYQSSAPYDAVSVPPARTERELAVHSRPPGSRLVGTTQLASLSVTKVDLEVLPGSYPTVVLQACVDVSGVDLLDRTGRSLVLPERVDRTKSTVTLYQYEVGTKGAELGGWYVYEATSKAEPC